VLGLLKPKLFVSLDWKYAKEQLNKSGWLSLKAVFLTFHVVEREPVRDKT